jgi:replicative superfamily II helicase
MTRENQVVNDELALVVAQRDALKRDLDEALQRLTVSQQMLQGRDKERQDILMSYRALNEEKQRTESGTNRVAMELHQVRAQVYAREEELMRARETISSLEQEQQRVAIDMLGLQRHSDLVSEKLLEAQERFVLKLLISPKQIGCERRRSEGRKGGRDESTKGRDESTKDLLLLIAFSEN